jgi:hypothetical protein
MALIPPLVPCYYAPAILANGDGKNLSVDHAQFWYEEVPVPQLIIGSIVSQLYLFNQPLVLVQPQHLNYSSLYDLLYHIQLPSSHFPSPRDQESIAEEFDLFQRADQVSSASILQDPSNTKHYAFANVRSTYRVKSYVLAFEDGFGM